MSKTIELTNNQKTAKVIARRREYAVAREELSHEELDEMLEMIADEFQNLEIDMVLFTCMDKDLEFLLEKYFK